MLDGAGEAVFAPCDRPQPFVHAEVDRNRPDAPIGHDRAAVRGAGLHAHLRDPDAVRATRAGGGELTAEAVEVGAQLGLRRVLLADLADLTTDADRDPIRLE